jgi:hypothetical protein
MRCERVKSIGDAEISTEKLDKTLRLKIMLQLEVVIVQ